MWIIIKILFTSEMLKKSFFTIYISLFLSVIFAETYIAKLIIPIFMWGGMLPMLYLYFNGTTSLTKNGKYILNIFIVTTCLWIARSYIIDDNSRFTGTPTLTIFGSLRFGVFMYLLPLMFLFSRIDMLRQIEDTLKALIAISVLLLLISLNEIMNGVSPQSLIWISASVFIIPFLHYINNSKSYIIILLSFLVVFHIVDERAVFINFILCLIGYLCVKIKIRRLYLKIAFYSGMLISIAILVYSLYYGVSIFQVLSSLYSEKTTLVNDTRSFIFYELSDDLSKNNQWVFGKGMLGTCYSPYFDNSIDNNADSAYRIGVEVGFLQYLLKGGLFYLILIMTTSAIAIFRAFFRSNNSFCKTIGFIILANFILSCVSQGPALNPYNFYLWIMIGFCYSKNALNLSDSEINRLINQKTK